MIFRVTYVTMNHHPMIQTQISAEERTAFFAKLQQLVQHPAGQLAKQDELYIEQQLSEVLGFEVAAELESNRLAHATGVMAALPHLRRYPSDVLANHQEYQEAGLASRRSQFGWFTELGQLTPDAANREKYFFAAPISFQPEWPQKFSEIKTWYKYRKMIVVNPIEKLAVVGVMADIDPHNSLQHQFGGSPEVVREGLIWSYQSRGKVLFLFVNDFGNQVPLGPIEL